MQLLDLTIQNFGPYVGKQTLDLKVTPDAPVIVIYGENTLGKSTLFKGIRWCLYGSMQPDAKPASGEMLREHLNIVASDAGDRVMSVSLKFEHNKQVFEMSRVAEFKDPTDSSPRQTVDLRIDGEPMPQSAIEQQIGKVLHPKVSEFFLFDGEMLSEFNTRLRQNREREELLRRVEQVLGIPALQMAAADVEDLRRDARLQYERSLKDNAELGRLQVRLERAEDDYQALMQDRAGLIKIYGDVKDNLNDLREQLSALEDVKGDVRELETLQAARLDAQRSAEALMQERRDALSDSWALPLRGFFQARLDALRQENSDALTVSRERSALESRLQLLRGQVESASCSACGQSLPDDVRANAHAAVAAVEAQLEVLAAPAELDLEEERALSLLVSRLDLAGLERTERELGKLRVQRVERDRRIRELEDRLAGHDTAKVARIAQQVQDLERQERELVRKSETNELERVKAKSARDKLARQIERLPGGSPRSGREAAFFAALEQLLLETISDFREDVRGAVESESNVLFDLVMRDADAYGGLRISEDFGVQLLDRQKRPVPTSAGGAQIVAVSLIGALKLQAVRSGPFILDSPLARLDVEHRSNLLQRWLPRVSDQAILLVQSGEITVKESRRILGGQLGREYEIVRVGGDHRQSRLQGVDA